MDTDLEERLRIREVIENWAVWRDAGDWERFATVWHREGTMMATWMQAAATQFIEASRAGFEAGVRILHTLTGISIDLEGSRAVAQTKMTITQRAEVEGVICDVICTGRFYDFFESRDNRWAIVLRQPIYEQDRLIPLDPTRPPKLDRQRLEMFPEGYRHLAYLQSALGYPVKPSMPGLTGPEVERLYGLGRDWLAGEDAISDLLIPASDSAHNR